MAGLPPTRATFPFHYARFLGHLRFSGTALILLILWS